MALLSPELRDFRVFLAELANHIRGDELSGLLLFYKDVIPRKHRERIKSAIELFDQLEQGGYLSPNNLVNLGAGLNGACKGNKDALTLLKHYEARSLSTESTAFPIEIISFLKEELGYAYKDFLRHLGLQDSYIENLEIQTQRNIQEVIHKSIEMWLQNKRDCSADQLRDKIKVALQKVKRNDLKEKVDMVWPSAT